MADGHRSMSAESQSQSSSTIEIELGEGGLGGEAASSTGQSKQRSASDPDRAGSRLRERRKSSFSLNVTQTFDAEAGEYRTVVQHLEYPPARGSATSSAADADGQRGSGVGGDGGSAGIGAGAGGGSGGGGGPGGELMQYPRIDGGSGSSSGGGGRRGGGRGGASEPVPLLAHPPLRQVSNSWFENDRRRKLFRPFMTWVVLTLIGVIASFVAWLMDESIDLLHRGHLAFALLSETWAGRYMLWVLYPVVMVALATTFTFFVSPAAAGSGIPEMKSILAGYDNPRLLTLRTLVAKAVGLVLAIGGGLVIGKEGPFVTTSACIAQVLMAHIPFFRVIRDNPHLRHHIIAAGCAVGVSATFGSPIGGVLFSIEVTSTYYLVPTYWKSFFAVVIGATVFKGLSPVGNAHENVVSLFTTEFKPEPYNFSELLFFVFLGILCGMLGAGFNLLCVAIARLRRMCHTLSRRRGHHQRARNDDDDDDDDGHGAGGKRQSSSATRPTIRSHETGSAGCCSAGGLSGLRFYVLMSVTVALLMGLVEFPLGHDVKSSPNEIKGFMTHGLHESINDLFSATDFLLPPFNASAAGAGTNGSASSSGAAGAGGRSSGNSSRTEDWNNPSIFLNLPLFTIIKLLTCALSINLFLPCGVVMPVFASGAAFGRLAGELLLVSGAASALGIPTVAGGYAVVGAAALTASVTGTVSIAVIVFELTNQLHHMMPVLLAVVVARAVGAYFSPNIFEIIGQNNRLLFNPELRRQESYYLSVRHVMAPVGTLVVERRITALALKEWLRKHYHHADAKEVPVVDDGVSMLYLGTVPMVELERLADAALAAAAHVDEIPAIDLADEIDLDFSTRHFTEEVSGAAA